MRNYVPRSESKHSWRMSDDIRDLIIARNLQILENPDSTDRAIGIASKLLLMVNAQNISLDDDTPDNNTIQIDIREIDT